MIDVLILPGTGFPHGDGISRAFAAALDPTRFSPRIVSYAAAYGGLDMPYAQSRMAGRRALLEAITGEHPYILAGYSQGAGVAGDLAAEIVTAMPGLVSDLYRGCALIADPYRPAGAGMPSRPVAPGYGIAGQRDIPGPVWWAAAPGDPITALPANNPLRSLADLTEWWSLAGPNEIQRWGADLASKCRRRAWQRWWNPTDWTACIAAIGYMRGYLVDGRHTADYLIRGHVPSLAATLNREIR